MASTISAATLTVTHTEALTLNGVDRGVTNTLTIASVNEVDHRIATVDTSAPRTLITLGDNVGSGTFVKTSVKYIRLTNKDDTNFVTLEVTAGDTYWVKLKAGESFMLMDNEMDAIASSTTFGAFADITKVSAAANTAACDIEYTVIAA